MFSWWKYFISELKLQRNVMLLHCNQSSFKQWCSSLESDWCAELILIVKSVLLLANHGDNTKLLYDLLQELHHIWTVTASYWLLFELRDAALRWTLLIVKMSFANVCHKMSSSRSAMRVNRPALMYIFRHFLDYIKYFTSCCTEWVPSLKLRWKC